MLTLHCWNELPVVSYSAISYPWRGATVRDRHALPNETIAVAHKPKSAGDEISVDVLRLACRLSLENGADLLWLDRLCIIQRDSNDVRWNLERMAHAYRQCQQCLIFPGGLRRLVSLDEPTPYNDRPWTLQEVLLPSKSIVVFSPSPIPLHRSIPVKSTMLRRGGHALYCNIRTLLQGAEVDASIRLFSGAEDASSTYLLDALERTHESSSWEEKYALFRSIWHSAILRKYSDPRDLFLCTMEVLGIRIKGKRDFATIAGEFEHAMQEQGLMDPRFIALAHALVSADTAPVWLNTRDRLLKSLPLIPLSGGVSVNLGEPLPSSFHLQIGAYPAQTCNILSKVYLGSVVCVKEDVLSIQPCTLRSARGGLLYIDSHFGEDESCHTGRVEILPVDALKMEWVPNVLSTKRRQVDAGFELDERGNLVKLFHGSVLVHTGEKTSSTRVFGKAGPHMVRYVPSFTALLQILTIAPL